MEELGKNRHVSSSSKASQMEVLLSKSHVMLRKNGQSLLYSRENGSLLPGNDFDNQLHSLPNKLCTSYGLIGKIRFFQDSDWYLLIIKEAKMIGYLPPLGGAVYCIERVLLIPLSVEKSIDEIKIETYAQDRREKDIKDKGKLEKRLQEALQQMFNGSQSFYFSYNSDLTQSVQRQHNCGDANKLRHWQRVDERFFWNKVMLSELIENFGPEIDMWVLPIIQGYIEIRQVLIPSSDHLGVFEHDGPPRQQLSTQVTVSSLESSMSGTVDIMSYDIIEKEGDSIFYHVYSPSHDEPLMKTIEQEDIPIIKENQSDIVSCHDNLLDSEASDEVHPLPDKPDHTHSSNSTPTPQGSPQIPHYSLIKSDDATPQVKHRSPRNSSDNQSHDSNASCDTDDLMNERFEGLPYESIEKKMEDIDGNKSGEDNVHWKKLFVPNDDELNEEGLPTLTMALVSRRSRYRAGTRYLRRGVDDQGHVANYIETEMIMQIKSHVVSFMIVRGSVPVYWTQPGNKYRPTPIIQQSVAETTQAFERHFENQINLYDEQVLVNLVNQSGRERVVTIAYEKQLLALDCPSLTYVAFDFHHHCKLNQWHNINLLLDNIEEYINRQKYFWLDLNYQKGPLCVQHGVFRVNCMDCLDRTNVVQSVLCKEVIQTSLQKLGLLIPFEAITGQFLRHYQEIWANNGDIISKQYTGTVAMKGDLTRYGHRRLYGVMRDGYNSAHRYIQSLFRDAYRQVVIDLQQGVPPQEALASLPQSQRGWEEDEQSLRPPVFSDLPSWSSEREQAIADMITICRNDLYANVTVPIKGWALIEPAGYSFVPTSDKEEETVLLLCQERRHICIANYNGDFEQVACCIRIPLDRIDRIVVGPIGTILKSSRRLYMRLHYTLFPGCSCYFTFRSVHSLSLEEDKLTLLSIAQELAALQPTISLQEQRLSKKHSQSHEGIVFLIAPSEWAKDDWETVLTPRSQPVRKQEGIPLSDIPYENLSSTSSTPTYKHHSRQSSSTSGIVAIINYNNQDDSNQSGYETDTDEDDDKEIEMSFSAPSSPNLTRRTSIISLQERSRLLSHSSFEDLKSIVSEEKESGHSEKNHPVKKRQSYSFMILESTSSDSEDDEVVNIDQVLSTSRLNSNQFSSKLSKVDVNAKNQFFEEEALLPNMHVRIPFPKCDSSEKLFPGESVSAVPSDVISQQPTQIKKVRSSTVVGYYQPEPHKRKSEPSINFKADSVNKSIPPTLSTIEANHPLSSTSLSDNVTEAVPTKDISLSDTSAGTSQRGGSRYLSRIKGKLFQKSKSQSVDNTSNAKANPATAQQLSHSSSDSNSVKNNVIQAIGILKSLGTKEREEENEVSFNSAAVSDEEQSELQLMRESMLISKTRFIII